MRARKFDLSDALAAAEAGRGAAPSAYPRAPLDAPVVAPTLTDLANEAFDASQEVTLAAEAIAQANEGDRDEQQALAAARAGLCSARERLDWLIAAVDAEAAPASGLRVVGSLDGIAAGGGQ